MIPQPHGEYPSHVAEWKGFGTLAWEREFVEAGFTVHRVLRLPLYSGYGFGLERLRRLGERWGLSSHNAFVVTANSAPPPELIWFEHSSRAAPTPALPKP